MGASEELGEENGGRLHYIVQDAPPWSDAIQPSQVWLLGQQFEHLTCHLNAQVEIDGGYRVARLSAWWRRIEKQDQYAVVEIDELCLAL